MRIPWRDIVFAVAVLGAVTLVRWGLNPYLGQGAPHIAFFVAILIVAWRTTMPVAIATAVAAWLLAQFLFVPPRYAISLAPDAAAVVGTLVHFLMAGFIILVVDRWRKSRHDARRKELHLELVCNAVPALISYIGPDRRYVSCNDAYTRWFGLPREQIIGRTVREVIGDESWRVVGPRLDEAFAGRQVEYEAESKYQRGGTRWVHVTYSPHRDVDGTVLGIVAMVTDIGHRKRAEQSAALLASIGEILSIGGSIDQSTRAVTQRLVSQLGLSRCLLAEIEGDDTVNIFHHESAEPEPAQLGAYRIADFLTPEERAKLASGVPLVINDVREGRDTAAVARFRTLGIGAVVSAPYVSDGRRKFTLAAERREPYAWQPYEIELLREISSRMFLEFDRARSQQTLRQSEQRFRSLVSVITDIPCTVDAQGRFVHPQEAWSKYTGQSWEQHRGCGWFDAVHPDDREQARLKWNEARRTRALFEARARIWHAATREHRHVVARATPVIGDDGAVREWVGACTDVHEEAKATEALLEADRRKDEFLATLAHELRNPLAPIRTSLHILRLTGKADGALANVHQMLERQVNLLVRLVDDLMEVSRITRGRIEIRKETADIGTIVRSAVETSRPLIDEARHSLEISLPREPLKLDADPVRLAQVLSNLLNNAAKYTAAGGRIRLDVGQDGAEAVISVRDNGRGIAAAMLPKVFDLFAQADDDRDRGQGGLGIGLTLVRSLVEQHQGRVEARSDGPGRGSEFIVRLPLPGREPDAADRERPAPAGPIHPARRILVVDDNRDAADSLGMLLTLLGVETRTAHDGRAALEALDTFAPSVMLLDLGMPGMNGYEVAERTRQHPRGREVTIVALTGWGQERDRRRSEQFGIEHHIVKPVDLDALRELLASLPPPFASSSILKA